jgi:natural resistance-associated macrophage protein
MAIIGSDIQEVIGCSIGLEIVFGLPLTFGVLITASAAFCFLFLERFGVRPLEMFFGMLILALACSMTQLFVVVKPDCAAVLEGFVVPWMPPSAVQQVVGMVGCVVMPHNLYLHSALVQSRIILAGEEKEAVTLFTIESSIAIFTSLLINMSVVAVFAKGFYGTAAADDLGLRNAGDYLGETFGKSLQLVWALGLIASGQSSTMTGAYTGQWVMQGYLDLKVAPWKRAIITRGIALVPCLTVAAYFGGGHSGLDALNTYLNVLQSLVLPFALVPLISFATCATIMGDLVLSRRGKILSWGATVLLIGTNIYLFLVSFWPDAPFDRSPAAYIALIIAMFGYVTLIAFVAWSVDLTSPMKDAQEPLIK